MDAGTYNFELEWDIREGSPVTFGTVFAEIRTNADQSITTASGSDVVQSQRVTTSIPEIFKVGSPGALFNQNVCRNNITSANPFIVKSVFYCLDLENNTKDIGRIFLRALKVK